MGQVFTWVAIRGGKVPKLSSFKLVRTLIGNVFANEPAILCALLFGSVVRGDCNRRSDVDCVVIYKTEEQAAAFAAMHKIARRAAALYVPVQFTTSDAAVAKTHLHHLGPAFIRHLQSAIEDGGMVKGGFAGILAESVTEREEIESYLRNKMRSLGDNDANSAGFSEERMAGFLMKAFEAPLHVARKMLILRGALRGDSKREVAMRYAQEFGGLARLFEHLATVDAEYTKEIERQLRGPDETAYAIALKRLENEVPTVLEFIRKNILVLGRAR